MNSIERTRGNPERRAEDETDIAQRLRALSDEESALLMGRLEALDPNDPDYERNKHTVADDTLKEIEAARQSKGEL